MKIIIILMFLTFSICLAVLIIILKISNKFRWYDIPNERTIHKVPIPRLGGVGILFSFLVVTGIFLLITDGTFNEGNPVAINRLWSFFISAFIISLVGLIDDFINLRAIVKLIAQIIVASIVIRTGHYFNHFYIPFIGITFYSSPIGIIFTFFWIIGITNAVNLIDGMDGLASGLSFVSVLFFACSAIVLGNFTDAGILFSLMGAILGFLFLNFPPAKIFMGDGGSLFLGFIIAIIPLYLLKNSISLGILPIISISTIFVPIYDTLTTIIRRTINGIPFFIPDNGHFHHKLLNRGFTTKQVLVLVYSFSIFMAFIAFLYILTNKLIFIDFLVIIWAFVYFIFYILSSSGEKYIFRIFNFLGIKNKSRNLGNE